MSGQTIQFTLNSMPVQVQARGGQRLVDLLRGNQLRHNGTKEGCGHGECGACTVLVDGEPVLSCVRAVSEFEGADIVTAEGLMKGGAGNRVQQAFIAEGAAQCGYCTPGIVIATTALLARKPKPVRADIAEALHGHLCRCGSHVRVLRAIDRLVREGGSDGA